MNSLDNDTDLLQDLLQGDERAYQIAVRKFTGGMLATAKGLVDPATAEDVVQETWGAVFDAIGQFQQRSSLQTWLNTITANRAKSRLRRSWREVHLDRLETESDFSQRFNDTGSWQQPPLKWDSVSPDMILQGEELRQCLDSHIGALPENLQTVLLMKDYLQLESDHICNILDISASNFRVLLHRARQRIYLMVEHFEETGEC